MNMRVPSILTAFLIVLLGAAVWTVTSSQAQTSATLSTPTYWTSFAQAEIAKPTYTPLPPPTATQPPPQISLPAESPTNTPESVAQAIIVDVPAGISSSTNAQAPVSYAGGKLILVDISEQHMYVYEGETLVYSFVASTGMNNATRTGSFSVLEKIPNAYGATWNIWMPNWLGIYWAGSLQNGIHALPILPNGATLWAGFLGTPISYGCVVLDTYDSQVLYDWAEVGVPVEIQW
ncbi:MAG: hypothetical protein RIR73_2015 [Chloroflexota bacterium]